MPEFASCVRCTVGVGVPVSEDENGAIYRCGNCGRTWDVPATKEAQLAAIGRPHPELSRGDLHALALTHGIDPDEYPDKTALAAALARHGRVGGKKAKATATAGAGGDE